MSLPETRPGAAIDAASAPRTRVAHEAASADPDPLETQEWIDSFHSLIRCGGTERGVFMLNRIEEQAQRMGVELRRRLATPYLNTIPVERQPVYPGDLEIERRISSIIRWNALAMVVRANMAHGELGGHIASFASAAEIFETGFNHFFRGPESEQGGDLVFFQPHSAPGIYARAFLEGRLSEAQIANFRRETGGNGLSSYPHPWLMPGFWQFPTGSMGIGPINSIYQARFMRYLEHRGLASTGARHVWGIFGDGEMDEPESVAALTLAAREQLDNLTFIVNCNLQRLDGPVRGNGQIVQELEALFIGAGWNVIKVLWGSRWDPLLARDRTGALARAFAETVDGQFQTYKAKGGAYGRAHFFGRTTELQALVQGLSDDQIEALDRGGHDFLKLHAAFSAARAHGGRPTVILAKTVKGFGMGAAGQAKMTTHQQKKLDVDALREFRDRFGLPLTDEDVASLRFWRPPENSPEACYLKSRRAKLGGYLPARIARALPVPIPPLPAYGEFALAPEGREMSTTMAFVRLLSGLLRDDTVARQIVPIVADEARTFGMMSLFRAIGIYSASGQLYEPEDASSLLSYREATNGQLLEEGITEAGALSSWIAAATAYSVHGVPLLPFYIFYSMFGFQRVGDLIWAAADQRARGFLIGATAGRTTLGGEGLQHQDGSSLLVAATVPNCRSYDPAFAYELAVILDHGAREMLERGADVFYYITAMNESYAQPNLPAGCEDGIINGMYRLLPSAPVPGTPASVRLLGSGAILREVVAAAHMLEEHWSIQSEVWSVTSYTELAREAHSIERWNNLHPLETPRRSHVQRCLVGAAPVIAASDYVRALALQIGPYVDGRFVALGTDGFGRSDTRAALRRFFEVDRAQIVLAALHALAGKGALPMSHVDAAIERYGIDREAPEPWLR